MHTLKNFTKEEFCIVVSRYSEDVNWTKPLGENCIIYNKGKSDLDYIDKERIILLDNVGKEGGTYIKHIIDNYENLSNHIAFLQGHPFDHIDVYNEEKSKQILSDILNEKKDYDFKYISAWMVKVNEDEISKYTSGLPSTPISFGLPMKIKKLLTYFNILINNYPFDASMMQVKDTLSILVNSKETIKLYEFADIINKIPYFMCNKKGNEIRDELFAKFDFSHILPVIKSGYYYGSGAMFVVSKKQILKHPKSFWIDLFKSFQEKAPAAGYGLEKLWPFLFLKN
jgi:hypothetical protein